MNEPLAFSPQPPPEPRRRLRAIAAVLAGLLLAAGIITFIAGPNTTASFGWFAFAPLSDEAFAPGLHFLTTAQILGWIFIALAACAAAFWAGLLLGRGRN